MAHSSIAMLSYTEKKNRFDSEFFQKEYIDLDKLIEEGLPISKIAQTVDLQSNGAFAQIFKTLNDNNPKIIPYIRSGNVGDFFLNTTDLELISLKAHDSLAKTHTRTGDVLMARKGKIGGATIIFNEDQDFNSNDNVVNIRITDNRFIPEYFVAFWNSYYGLKQVERFATGNVQPWLSMKQLRQLKTVLIEANLQQEIKDIILRAYDNKKISEKKYKQAQHLLESELGLDKLKFKKPVGYTARFSDLEQSRRIDPEHFYPAFQNLVANLPYHVELAPLGTQLTFCQRGKQPAYSQHGLPVVNSKHVQPNKVVLEGNRTASVSADTNLRIRQSDILMNGTGRGTLGRVAPYLSAEEAIPDNHVTILRSPTLDPAYLSFYLNSLAGKLQVEMHQRGTSGQLELYPFDIRKFLVWVAPDSFQKEIRNLYDQAAASERRSKELLDQAKTRVEQLIEEAAAK